MVKYTYDSWGKVLSITGNKAGTIGVINPLRYRSYVYDEETGLYFLQSRYYDSVVGRFINADGYASTGQGVLGNNMFAYCGNNPVMYSDPDGHSVILACIIGGAIIGALAGGHFVASTAKNSSNPNVSSNWGWYAAAGIVGGGIVGGLIGWGIGVAVTAIGVAVKAVKTAKQGVAIGEKMAARVESYARANNLSTYKGIKGYKTIEKVIGKKAAGKLGMAHNKVWITHQVKLGTKIFDIGPAGSQIVSPYYAMERSVVKGYFNYIKCF